MKELLLYITEKWKPNNPDRITVKDKKGKNKILYAKGFNDTECARAFTVNTKMKTVIFSDINGTHYDMFSNASESELKRVGLNSKTWQTDWDAYDDEGAITKIGRIYDLSLLSSNDIDDKYSNLLIISFWPELTDTEFKTAANTIIDEYVKRYNKKAETSIFYIVSNNGELIKSEKNKLTDVGKRSDETKDLINIAKAIHLASQKEKREFTQQWRETVASNKDKELQKLGVRDGTYAKRNNTFTKNTVYDPKTGKYKVVYGAKIGDSLEDYVRNQIMEGDNDDDANKGETADEEKKTERGNIKFTIWEEPDKKVKWLNNNEKYQKIEYQYNDKEEGLELDFLLGFQNESWKLWIGKIGACSYDDDPYYSFGTKKFGEAMVMCLDTVEEFLKKVKEDKDNYIQFYLKK